MILVGRYLSPFVRRVAVTLQWLDVAYEHRSLSPADQAEDVRALNPMVKVPVLVLDDGPTLIESSAILDSLLQTIPGQTLLPASGVARRDVLQQCGMMTSALDKSVAALYERVKRPKEKIHQPFLDHLIAQASAGFDLIEAQIRDGKLAGVAQPSLADLTAAVGYTFASQMLPSVTDAQRHPLLAKHAESFEQTKAFSACRFQV
jgi:glutathione S-transferase